MKVISNNSNKNDSQDSLTVVVSVDDDNFGDAIDVSQA